MVSEFSALVLESVYLLLCLSIVRTGSRFIPWLDELGDGEQCSKDNAQSSNNNVRNPEERIPPSHHRPSRDEDRLRPIVSCNGKV